jgi:hypothetical protein
MGSRWLPTIKIEAGLSGPTIDSSVWQIGDPTRGVIGTAAIGGDMIWVDISPWVRNWSMRRGSSRSNDIGLRYDAGTVTVELNNGDRRFDPTNLTGPYAVAGFSTVQPMVRIRITATWANQAYQLYTGFADSWVPDYTTPNWSTTTLTATDAFKVLNAVDRTELGAPIYPHQDSGSRAYYILASAGWSLEETNVYADGQSTLQATTMGGNVLSELQLVQDSEMGELYVNKRGFVVFRNRHKAFMEYRSATSQATFGDGGLATNGEIPYQSAPVDFDDSAMANYVSITNVGGTEQIAQDATSHARYLRKTYSRSDLILETDADAKNYAQSILYQSKDPELRFSSVTCGVPRAGDGATVWPALLDRELGDRVTVIRRPPGGATPNQRDVFVRGIEYSSDGSDWKTTFQLQSADKQAFWTIGDPVLGRVGLNAIAF